MKQILGICTIVAIGLCIATIISHNWAILIELLGLLLFPLSVWYFYNTKGDIHKAQITDIITDINSTITIVLDNSLTVNYDKISKEVVKGSTVNYKVRKDGSISLLSITLDFISDKVIQNYLIYSLCVCVPAGYFEFFV